MSETTVRINGDTFAKIADVWYDTYGDEVVGDTVLCAALDELAAALREVKTLRADLAAVRKVEEWLHANTISRFLDADGGRLHLWQRPEGPLPAAAEAESIPALGRALAAQEGGDGSR